MTKIYADGSRHVEQTVTEAGERIGASGRETYEKIITYVDGVQDKVEESAQQIDTSVTATQKRIDEALSGAKSELSSGIFGIIKDGISAVKNKDWAGIARDGDQAHLGPGEPEPAGHCFRLGQESIGCHQ